MCAHMSRIGDQRFDTWFSINKEHLFLIASLAMTWAIFCDFIDRSVLLDAGINKERQQKYVQLSDNLQPLRRVGHAKLVLDSAAEIDGRNGRVVTAPGLEGKSPKHLNIFQLFLLI
jgi:hypothetical protein